MGAVAFHDGVLHDAPAIQTEPPAISRIGEQKDSEKRRTRHAESAPNAISRDTAAPSLALRPPIRPNPK